MKLRRKAFFFLGLLALAGPSWAAERTIQFAGLAANNGDRNLPNLSPFIACTIMVANTGATTQYVKEVRFSVFDSGSGSRLTQLSSSGGAATELTQEDVYYRDDSGTNSTPTAPQCTAITGQAGCTGAGHAIPRGGLFIATVKTLQLNMQSFTAVPCYGSLTVADAVPNSPGSVVATGAISFVGEQAITGGQFQGALYLSGNHYKGADLSSFPIFNASGGTAPIQAAWQTGDRFQMNAYCAAACRQMIGGSADRDDYCSVACGGEQKGSFGPPNDAYKNSELADFTGVSTCRYRNSFGWLEESASTFPFGFGNLTPRDADSSFVDTGGNSWPFHNTRSGAANLADVRALFRTANPHFAGGQVIEMIVGPFDSICSANYGYWINGGDDFDHSDSSVWADNNNYTARRTGSMPPERLYCSHAHNMDSPYGYIAQSSPFTIWGGNAF